ncbi:MULTISPECIES: ABC transporter substrate-binding protein [unclassified Microbacterium]|uniref:ABC transporter substrate-binding protein n=1 Tax=unclassified Microbacterium TaxID=2609290 RepID=UPI00097EBA36|nr:ABC transporter substrate-binding protein [Microbacterium sp. JB110]RCS61321.1 LacI family transcriptional regulator [Microbacterium sp. JB110]SJM50826.1 Ribose ABC transport system, periplasmic ribose-binding protein RbsB (TC 3.A.1.2.1) [Frigoribacterium sp. JB110]
MRKLRTMKPMAGAAFAAMVVFALAGCTNTGETATTGDEGEAAEAANEQPAAEGEGCTIDDYGVDPVELEGATVGFSQSEPDSAAFRAAETQSIRDAAADAGAEVIVTNANAELPKQISDIQEMINQGVDILVVAPVNSDGLTPALDAASDAGVPVVTIDRKVTDTSCEDYLTFLGSDFYVQGQRAADQLAAVTDEEANVAVLLGPSGNNVTDGRRDGFVEQVEEKYPDINIVAEQTANASRDEGQTVTAQLLQTNPEIDAVYAFNDESGLGAMAAVQEAGKQAGEDIKIVSVDGTRNAVQAIVDGNYNAVIESNPRFGPLVFETLQKFYDGEAISEDVIIADGEYTAENAEKDLGQAF